VVELAARRVLVGSMTVALTRREFDLVAFFAQNPDRAVSRRELVARLWGDARGLASQRTVDIHVQRLRAKLSRTAFPLETVFSVGYRLAATTTQDDRNAETAPVVTDTSGRTSIEMACPERACFRDQQREKTR
jgi:DNA-binding winged helix-turn-helix (wHTH) protein